MGTKMAPSFANLSFLPNSNMTRSLTHPGGGGGLLTPLYGLYRYVRPQRVGFFSGFGHKWGIDFCTLDLNLFVLLEEATSSLFSPPSIRRKADEYCLQHWSELEK